MEIERDWDTGLTLKETVAKLIAERDAARAEVELLSGVNEDQASAIEKLTAEVERLRAEAWAPSLDALDALVTAVRSLERAAGGEYRAEVGRVIYACDALRLHSNEHEEARVTDDRKEGE